MKVLPRSFPTSCPAMSRDRIKSSVSESEIGSITKLGPSKGKFDIDFNDNERHYVRSEDSEELRQFFADVRSLCLAKISKDPELYYPQDVDKLQHQEWMIRRFMTHHKGDRMHMEDSLKTSETIIKMMQWKRKMNLWGRVSLLLSPPHPHFPSSQN